MKEEWRRLHLTQVVGARLEALAAKGWALAGGEHPLGRLQGRPVGSYRLLTLLGPKNSVGARYFQLFLRDRRGRLTRDPVALGLHSSGALPGFNWLELVRYQGNPSFDPSTLRRRSGQAGSGRAGDSLDLAAEGLDRELFLLLSELVPAGGHLMVEYESASQRASERILGLGYPPVASPLGYLLLQAGCRSFRDWYIPEGGREGPRKLQGFKPLDGTIAGEKSEELRRQLSELLSSPEVPRHGEWGRAARLLAQKALEEMGQGTGNKEQGSRNKEQGTGPLHPSCP